MDNMMALTGGIQNDLTNADLSMYTSLDTSTTEGRISVYNALTNPTGRVSEVIGKTICVTDLVVEPTVVTDDTGAERQAVRTILITEDGKSYQATSYGIYNAVKRIFAVFGPPHWDGGLKLEVKQVTTRGRDGQPRNILTLALA